MKTLMRMWHEFRNPRLKCGEIGCTTRTYTKRGYEMDPERLGHHYAAYSVKFKITECTRCGKKHTAVVSRRGLDSITLDRDRMEELEETGRVIM